MIDATALHCQKCVAATLFLWRPRHQLNIRRSTDALVASSPPSRPPAPSASTLEALPLPSSALPASRTSPSLLFRLVGGVVPCPVALVAFGVREGPLEHNAGPRALVAVALRPHHTVLNGTKRQKQSTCIRRRSFNKKSRDIVIRNHQERQWVSLHGRHHCNRQTSRCSPRQTPCRSKTKLSFVSIASSVIMHSLMLGGGKARHSRTQSGRQVTDEECCGRAELTCKSAARLRSPSRHSTTAGHPQRHKTREAASGE